MNRTSKIRRYSLLSITLFSAVAVACGTVDPEPEPGVNDAPSAGAVGGSGSATSAEPLPELRTNDAGAVLVSQEEMLRLIDSGTAPLILDVRRPDEFEAGHIPGAVLIPHTELADRLDEIGAARENGLIVYCRSGRRAGIAEELLIGAGFSDVQHLEGDMNGWVEAGLRVER